MRHIPVSLEQREQRNKTILKTLLQIIEESHRIPHETLIARVCRQRGYMRNAGPQHVRQAMEEYAARGVVELKREVPIIGRHMYRHYAVVDWERAAALCEYRPAA